MGHLGLFRAVVLVTTISGSGVWADTIGAIAKVRHNRDLVIEVPPFLGSHGFPYWVVVSAAGGRRRCPMVAKTIKRLPSKLDFAPTSQRYRAVSDTIQGGL